MTPRASGSSFTNTCDGNPATLTYAGSWTDASVCMSHLVAGCIWNGGLNSSFSSTPIISSSVTFTGWGVTSGLTTVDFTLQLSGTTWTVELSAEISNDPTHELIFFRGTLSDPSPDCKNPSLTFTNAAVIGACYTTMFNGKPATGVATGGTMVISFVKSCCP